MKRKLGEKIISLILTFNLVFSNFAPFVSLATVRAQDVTPEPTVEVTVSPTEEPSSNLEVSPTETVSPTVVPTQDVTPTETIEATPTVEVTSVEETSPTVEPTLEPTEAPSVPSPPESTSPSPTPEMSVEPSPSPTPEAIQSSALIGNVETEVVESYSCRADSLNGCLITDKADYAPTDVAIISGYGFAPNTSYTLRVYSTDEPAVDNSYQITTDPNGSFTYSYQLDGTYRPNYTVELIDNGGFVVASVTFTDSPSCQNDVNGANDEPGQRDLTRMCADYDSLPTTLKVTWNWDDIAWSGSNTGDACALFDTDGDGNANNALCVTVSGTPAAFQSKTLYSCNDTKTDRCGSPNSTLSASGTICTSSIQSTDPFLTGGSYPDDTVASCSVAMSDISASAAELIDVCAYPSSEPNSAPTDCIIATSSQTGTIEVIKDLVPSTDSGLFNLQVDGSTLVSDVSDGGTTSDIVVLSSGGSGTPHTFGETAGTGTNLANYIVSASCVNSTGASVSITGNNPWTVNITNNADITCTITNTRINNATLTIVKNAIPNDPQDFSFTTTGTGLSNFSLDDDSDPTLSNTITFNNLASGTYSVTEVVPSGWTQTSATCTDGSPVNAINLSAGENVTCTFTNTKKGHIVVDKVTNPTGDSQSFDFTVTGTGYSTFSLTDAATPNDQELLPGNYSVSETVPTGWDLSNTTCVSSKNDAETANDLSIDPGETITCTFTNTKRGSISGYKYDDADGSNSTTNDRTPLANWTIELWQSVSNVWSKLTDTLTNALGFFQFLNLVPGQYEVREVNQAGWSPVSPTGVPVTLGAGQNSTGNNFVNTKYGKIIVEKQTVPDGDQTVFDFDLSYGDNDADLSDGQQDDSGDLLPGSYSVSENTPAGWELTSTVCTSSKGDTEAADDLKLDSGEIITCVFSNSRKPTLTLVKTVVNDNGGSAEATDFQGKINGNNVPWSVAQTLNPGNYTASETTLPNYTASVWGTDCAANGTITLAYGDNKICSITNNDNAPSLTLNKVVVNDNGGTALESDWIITATGPTSISGFGATGSSDVVSGPSFDAGTYTLSESTGPVGYSASSWVCTGGSQNGNEITVSLGESATCTITNDDDEPSLTLVKQVTNDDGGTSLPSAWTLIATGPTGFSGAGPSVSNGTSYDAGTYDLSESGPGGYTASDWVCVGGNQLDGNTISIGLGENVTCTITNDDIAPTLKLVKEVVTDNGGTAVPDDWTLFAEAETPDDDRNFDNLGGSGDFESVYANVEYDLSESTVGGYSAGSWNCDGGILDGSTLILGLNEDVTCTITNNDQTGRLVVIKVLINDNGGDLNNEDFSYTVNDGISIPFENDGQNEDSVDSGLYSIVEDAVDGYETTYENCEEVFVPNGGSATCTITNNDIAPTLKLVKSVTNDNGGDAVAGDWDLTASGNGGFTDQGDSITFHTVLANEPYTLSESSINGYAPGTWDCENAGLQGDVVMLGLDEDVTCTITNDDIAPTLTLVKEVVNNYGESASGSEWTLTASGDGGFSGSGPTVGPNDVLAGIAYSLSESDGVFGYTASDWVCDVGTQVDNTITLALEENATCKITNTRDTGTIIVNKIIDPDGIIEGEGADEDQFPGENWEMTVTGNTGDTDDPASENTDSTGGITFEPLKTGEYNITEDLKDGYKLIDAYCDEGENGFVNGTTIYSVEVGKDDIIECTFINSPNSTLHGYKWSDEDQSGGPLGGLGEDLLSGWTINLYKDNGEGFEPINSMLTDDGLEHFGWYWFEHLFPGDYKICEEEKAGWVQTYPTDNDGCHLVTLPDDNSGGFPELLNAVAGPTYNFGNVEYGRVIVTKYSDDNGDGNRDEGEDVLSGWTMNLKQGEDTLDETTNDIGEATFEDVLPGGYILSEVEQEGYILTNITCSSGQDRLLDEIEELNNSNQVELTVYAGETTNCEIGNQYAIPELQISKSNDATGDKSIGDLVTYTLKVKALKSQVKGVVLKDLLPNGFSFQSVLSIIKNGTDDITATVGDPFYASPGTYNLGDMNIDDEIVIKYTAKIGSSVDPGLYKDIAYAFGKDILDNRVLALAQPEGFVSTNFVGTSVNVNATLTQSGNIDIGGEVLGASTYLPATGGNQIWVILASILTSLGLLFMLAGLFMKKAKKVLVISLLIFGFWLFGAGSVSAANLSIRLEQPKSPTSKNDFKITYTVLDLSEAPGGIIAKCFKKGPADGGYSQFGSDIMVSAGGNSGECANVSDFVNTNGTYQFYATATNGSETATSESEGIISIGYNTQGDPTPPSNYKKEKISSCQYRITFRTANDGLTTRVEVYRSENTSFNLDGGTRVGDISIGPNQDGTFEESVPDCNKTYYYVVRSFNSSGNPSGPVGDSAVTVTSGTTTVEGGAVPVEGVTLPGGGAGGGQILGEEKKDKEASPTSKPEVVEVKEKGVTGAVKGVADFVKNRTKLSLLIGLGVLALGYGAYYFIKKRKS